MTGRVYALDTSALMTLIEGEAGADRVEEVLREEHSLLPFPVLMEVHYMSRREQGRAEADRRYAVAKQLPSRILWQIDEPILLTAARFKASHKVSFADAMIAAFAKLYGAILLHKDPEFEVLAEEIGLEALPYKPRSVPSRTSETQDPS